MILEKIDQLLEEVKNISATNADEIEALRLKYLSKKCAITALMNDFRNVPPIRCPQSPIAPLGR